PHLLTEIAPAEDELLLTPAPQPKSAGRTLPGGAAPRERYSERPAPPISVFAAWDRDDMAKLLTGFAADRRMAAAEVEIERGGLDAVIARLGQPCPPDLIVLDTNLGGAELLRGLDRLACAI